jgi:hypothetical protein
MLAASIIRATNPEDSAVFSKVPRLLFNDSECDVFVLKQRGAMEQLKRHWL